MILLLAFVKIHPNQIIRVWFECTLKQCEAFVEKWHIARAITKNSGSLDWSNGKTIEQNVRAKRNIKRVPCQLNDI